MSIVIRSADPDDAAGACEVVCNSIVHACTRDHLRDPQRLLRWLQNKTVDNFAAWCAHRQIAALSPSSMAARSGSRSSIRTGIFDFATCAPNGWVKASAVVYSMP